MIRGCVAAGLWQRGLRKGDELANKGEHNRRHNSTLYAIADSERAVATQSIDAAPVAHHRAALLPPPAQDLSRRLEMYWDSADDEQPRLGDGLRRGRTHKHTQATREHRVTLVDGLRHADAQNRARPERCFRRLCERPAGKADCPLRQDGRRDCAQSCLEAGRAAQARVRPDSF